MFVVVLLGYSTVLAEVSEKEILFRGIPWGRSDEEVVANTIDLEQFSAFTYLKRLLTE